MTKYNRKSSIFTWEIIAPALWRAFYKLNPYYLLENPVILCVEIVSIITTIMIFYDMLHPKIESSGFALQISIWLWFTVLFANFAEAVAEGKGKAQANMLKKTKHSLQAKVLRDINSENFKLVTANELKTGMLVLIEAGDFVPGDGEVVRGMAVLNESAITGESAPVIRESGGDRSAVTAGTQVISDKIIVRICSEPGNNFLDRMIGLVEGAKRQKPPNEVALGILLSGFTIIFIVLVFTLKAFSFYFNIFLSVVVLSSLFITLIPTTIAGLLSAIGISGMDRLMQSNVLALSGRAVESAGDVDTLLLDKTGTITFGNRMAHKFIPMPDTKIDELAHAALLASLKDETPEGRSIVDFAVQKYNLSGEQNILDANYILFSAQTRMSGVDLGERKIRKGAASAVMKWLEENNKHAAIPVELNKEVEKIARSGGTPLAVATNEKILGLIYLKDIVKPDIKERFLQMREMGIKTIMITGDNPLTAASIAAESGVDDFIAEATPEAKLKLIRQEQAKGKMVAMCGDGTNDAPALAQADVGVAMVSGTIAAREAGNMVDLDSDPSKIIEIVKIGKQLLMTRGALTTFSISNDVAKYFAIIPAMFANKYPILEKLNIMHLQSAHSAIISAIIFNALIIIALIPLALRGVKFKVMSAANMLKRNLLIYGLGGIIAPFICIKIIDIILNVL